MEQSVVCKGWKIDYDVQDGMPKAIALNGVTVFRQQESMFRFALDGISTNNNHKQMEEILGTVEAGGESRLIEQELNGQQWHVWLALEQGMELLCDYQFYDEYITVSLSLTNKQEETRRLRWLAWTVGMPFHPGCRVIAPGQLPPLEPAEYLAKGEEGIEEIPLIKPCGKLAPAEISSLCGVYDSGTCMGAYTKIQDGRFSSRLMHFSLEKGERAVSVRHIYCPQLLLAEQTMEIGPLYLGVQQAGEEEEIVPAITACSLGEMSSGESLAVIEAGIGSSQARAICSSHEQLRERINVYREAGFDTLLLDPVFPWPGWNFQKPMDIEFTYGVGVKETIGKAHENGMKVLLTVSLRGVYEFDEKAVGLELSPYLNGEQDSWFMQHETGRFARSFNSRVFGAGHPGFIRHMEDVLSLYMRELKPDGFFLEGQMYSAYPDWNPEGPDKPWEAVLAGVALGGILKEHLQKDFPDILFLSDCGCGQAGFVPDAFLWDGMQWGKYGLAPLLPKRGYKRFHSFVGFKELPFSMETCHNFFFENSLSWQDFGRWQEEAMLAAPCGNLLHHLDSGKSNEWTWFAGGYANENRFGEKVHTVLTAICLMMPGGFLSFDYGSLCAPELMNGLLQLKRTSPVFRTGICSLTRLCCDDPKVAVIHWQGKENHCTLAANLEGVEKVPSFTMDGIPYRMNGKIRLYDGKWRETDKLVLPPYGIALIQGDRG
ncbi:hypothetical protein D3Z45_17610 [Lachnospiraceae bacterium]|nr:hypothetical protein [Lachnospiraceae bacterium]